MKTFKEIESKVKELGDVVITKKIWDEGKTFYIEFGNKTLVVRFHRGDDGKPNISSSLHSNPLIDNHRVVLMETVKLDKIVFTLTPNLTLEHAFRMVANKIDVLKEKGPTVKGVNLKSSKEPVEYPHVEKQDKILLYVGVLGIIGCGVFTYFRWF